MQKIHISLNGIELEQVDTFNCFGITIKDKGNNDIEINNRLQNANAYVYYAMNKGFVSKKEISKQPEVTVFKTIH